MNTPRPRGMVPVLPASRQEDPAGFEPQDLEPESPRAGTPVTISLIAVFALVFALELAHSAILLPGLGLPAVQTLQLLGAGVGVLVFEDGQYYRLLVLGFLHAGFAHLIMNALALLAIGRRLEPWIGGRWFLALFFAGTSTASLASMWWNPIEITAVGASGGIMALGGFLGVASLALPPGRERRLNLDLARGLVLATLLVGFFLGLALRIDNAAHLGGLVFGGVAALAMRPLWPEPSLAPRGGAVAVALVLAGFALIGYGIAAIIEMHHLG